MAGRRVMTALVATTAAFAVWGVSAAQAGIGVVCGTTITADSTLSGDIGPCPGHGVIIGADNITLDLNGHTILGDGSDTGSGVISNSHSNVTVTSSSGRGTIENFLDGVFLTGGGGNTVSRLRLTDNFGESLAGGYGINAVNETNDTITHNLIARNGPFAGIGISGAGTDYIVSGNTLRKNKKAAGGTAANGITLGNNVDDSVVKRNEVTDSGSHGIFTNGARTRVVGNTVTGSGANDPDGNGIFFNDFADRGRILDNEVHGSSRWGIFVVAGANRNRIIGNTSTGNDDFDLLDGNTNCDHNTWSLNTFGTANPACAGA